MLPQNIRDAAKCIGEFYLSKNEAHGDHKYDKTAGDLLHLLITKLEIDETTKVLEITTGRPGMLIGRRGKNIQELCDWVMQKLQLGIRVVEDMDALYDTMVPDEPAVGWDEIDDYPPYEFHVEDADEELDYPLPPPDFYDDFHDR